MRRVLLPLVLCLALVACGDDGPATSPTPVPDAGTTTPQPTPGVSAPIAFVDGLAAGKAAAGDDDAVLLVYLARHHPT